MKLHDAISVVGLLFLLVGPLYWALTPITYGENSMLPQAGPGSGSMGGFNGKMPAFNGPQGDSSTNRHAENYTNSTNNGQTERPNNVKQSVDLFKNKQGGMNSEKMDKKTLSYLKKNNTGETYLFATTSYQTAAPYMINEGESVIIMGGFSGSDPVYTVEKLKKLIKSGKVKYFLLSDGGMRGGSSEVTEWIKKYGEKIPSEQWQTTQNSDDQAKNMMGPGGSNTLYKVTLE